MTLPTHDASARQHSGEPSPIPCRGGDRTSRAGSADITKVERQIAELLDRSTQELRLAWRQLHRTGPPQGLSRDLLIRALAHELQERASGGASRGLRHRLYRSLTVIAERITGAHWSGPRYFGLTKRTGASVSAEAGE